MLFPCENKELSGIFNLILCLRVFCLHMCMYTVCVPHARGGQKRPTDALELEIQMVISHHWGTRNETWVLCNGSMCSKLQSHVFSPSGIFILIQSGFTFVTGSQMSAFKEVKGISWYPYHLWMGTTELYCQAWKRKCFNRSHAQKVLKIYLDLKWSRTSFPENV